MNFSVFQNILESICLRADWLNLGHVTGNHPSAAADVDDWEVSNFSSVSGARCGLDDVLTLGSPTSQRKWNSRPHKCRPKKTGSCLEVENSGTTLILSYFMLHQKAEKTPIRNQDELWLTWRPPLSAGTSPQTAVSCPDSASRTSSTALRVSGAAELSTTLVWTSPTTASRPTTRRPSTWASTSILQRSSSTKPWEVEASLSGSQR